MYDWLHRIMPLVLILILWLNWSPSIKAQSAQEINRITSIVQDKSRAFVQLNTALKKEVAAPSIQYLPGGEEETILAADFTGLVWNKPSEIISYPTDGLSQVRIGQFEHDPPICRVSVVATRPRVLHEIVFDSSPGQLVIKWPKEKGKGMPVAVAMVDQASSSGSGSTMGQPATNTPTPASNNVPAPILAMTTHPAFSPPVKPAPQFVPRANNSQIAYRPIQSVNTYKPLANSNSPSKIYSPPPTRQTSTLIFTPLNRGNSQVSNFAFFPTSPKAITSSQTPAVSNVKPAPLVAQGPITPKKAPQLLPSFNHPTIANPVRFSSPVHWTGGRRRSSNVPWLIFPMAINNQQKSPVNKKGAGQVASSTTPQANQVIQQPFPTYPSQPTNEEQTPAAEPLNEQPISQTPSQDNQSAPVPNGQFHSSSPQMAALIPTSLLSSPRPQNTDTAVSAILADSHHRQTKIQISGVGPVLIEIQAGQKLAYRAFRLHDPERYVLDFDGLATLVSSELPEPKPNSLLKSLRVSNADIDSTTRIVLDLADKEVDVKETTSDSNTSLLLTLSMPSTPIAELPLPAETTVVLDAGHGGTDPGAQRGEIQEKDLTLQIVDKLRKVLEEKGIKVVTTRADDTFVSLENRVSLTNSINPHAFISVHINSLETNQNIHGIETYYLDKKSKELADLIHNSLVTNLKAPDRSVRKARFYVINHTPVPAVLAEVGYISNKDERDKLISSDYQKNVADALAQGVMLYLYQQSKIADSPKPDKNVHNQVHSAYDLTKTHKPSSLAVAPAIPKDSTTP